MFNYNVINPVNIHYRKYSQNESAVAGSAKKKQNQFLNTDENGSRQHFPNGNKVAIDYTKNQVNISQVLQDFRSTIAAINSPEDVKEEVESYLGLVGKESQKETPSREIVLSNLKNAARITDKYIQDSLKKPSSVVQDWVDALFLQKVNLKADPSEINEDFRVKIPSKNKELEEKGGVAPLNEDVAEFSKPEINVEKEEENNSEFNNVFYNEPNYTAENAYIESFTPSEEDIAQAAFLEEFSEYDENSTEENEIENNGDEAFVPESGMYGAKTQNEAIAKQILLQGKTGFEDGKDIYDTLKLYDKALELTQDGENTNLRSAIYYERGRVLDSYDYADLALIDYHRATKAEDNNLKAQAHIKMGNIYDDYVQIDPAIDQYSRAVTCSEEAENPNGKTRALRYMASMFAGIYDKENTEIFSDLALESAKETNNSSTIAKTYLEVAKNYQYIGEDSKALEMYSSLAQDEGVQDDYESLAQNYMEASALMDKKGNKKKSYALLLKSKEYQRKARLQRIDMLSGE